MKPYFARIRDETEKTQKELIMKNHIILFGLSILILTTTVVFAQNKGGKEQLLDGGKQGNITFPHHLHQVIAKDCMVCHGDFPQKSGALKSAKDSGELKKRQVMNKICLKCHRERKKAGEKTGPTKCSGCHVK